jgi:hypothetical protein
MQPAGEHGEAEGGIADAAAHPHPIAGPRTGAAQRAAWGDMAEDGEREAERPRCRGGIAAEQGEAEFGLIGGEAGGEGGEPRIRRVAWGGECQQIAERHRTHRRQIGEIDPQQLARDQPRRIVRQAMHAGHHGIRRDHQLASGRWREECGIVEQIETGRPGERAEMPRDQGEFARRDGAHRGATTSAIMPTPPGRGRQIPPGAAHARCG